MKNKKHILEDVGFWVQLSERYFEADTTQEEERALMRFVTSQYASHDSIDEHSKRVFKEVKATMSYMMALGEHNSHYQTRTVDISSDPEGMSVIPKRKTMRRWFAATAAVIALFFIMNRIYTSENDNEPIISDTNSDITPNEYNICLASDNGILITDKSKVISMMQASWREVDIQEGISSEVGEQLKELFDVLE